KRDKNEKIIFNLDDDINKDEDFDGTDEVFNQKSDIDLKKEKLSQQADERINKLKKLSKNLDTNDDLKEKIEVPAYLRRNVTLVDPPHSSENNISRLKLNDENQILGNNKFFTDKPD
ncbi:MAG: cell division protein FtsZ, partial [Bacteroidota bacterium]